MKVVFLTPLHVEKVNGGDFWRVLVPFRVSVDGDLVEVPAGYLTDFASVPRLPLAYLLAGNTAHKSAVLHDYLYAIQAGRKKADEAFLAAMKVEGIPGWRRNLMYAAVRSFGWGPYRRMPQERAAS